jgi:hypothetical protein
MDQVCQSCFLPIKQPLKGRKATYCSNACKQYNYRLKNKDWTRQRLSSRTKPDFIPAPPKSGNSRLLTLPNTTQKSNVYTQINIVDVVGFL